MNNSLAHGKQFSVLSSKWDANELFMRDICGIYERAVSLLYWVFELGQHITMHAGSKNTSTQISSKLGATII